MSTPGIQSRHAWDEIGRRILTVIPERLSYMKASQPPPNLLHTSYFRGPPQPGLLPPTPYYQHPHRDEAPSPLPLCWCVPARSSPPGLLSLMPSLS